MRRVPILLLLVLCGAPAFADEDPAAVGEAVVRAHRAGDTKALEAIANAAAPDPWLIAEELCFQGEVDAALAMAKASTHVDTARLVEYLASRGEAAWTSENHRRIKIVATAYEKADWARVLELTTAVDDTDDLTALRLQYGHAEALRQLGKFRACIQVFTAVGEAAEQRGWLARAEAAFREAGDGAERLGDIVAMRAASDRLLAVAKARGRKRSQLAALMNRGLYHARARELNEAVARNDDALQLARELGDRNLEAHLLMNLGIAHMRLGALEKAIQYQTDAGRIFEELGDIASVASTRMNIGAAYGDMARHHEALDYTKQAYEMAKDVASPEDLAAIVSNVGLYYRRLGLYAQALAWFERALEMNTALGLRGAAARTAFNLGVTYRVMGQPERAKQFIGLALADFQELGMRHAEAKVYSELGGIAFEADENELALEYKQKAHAIVVEQGIPREVARSLSGLASVMRSLGAHDEALDLASRAMEVYSGLGDKGGMAWTHAVLGSIHYSQRNYQEAKRQREAGVRLAEESGYRRALLHLLVGLARAQLALYAYKDSVATARRAVEELGGVSSGLAEEQAATSRDEWFDIFEIGFSAAHMSMDTEAGWYFIESGRAIGLLESLGGRHLVGADAVPVELRNAEGDALAAEARAAHELSESRRSGNRKAVRAAREALEQARSRRTEVVERIRRAVKAKADVLYPTAAEIEDAQAALEPDEAILLYFTTLDITKTLVVTAEDARMVLIGRTPAVKTAAAALEAALEDGTSDATKAIQTMRPVVSRLTLPERIGRIYVSPSAPLARTPFALLAPNHEVVYIPSATTWLALASETQPGSGILALADPVYADRKLMPLPATRAEAEAVGDVLLLGEDATETRLVDSLSKRERWRAVHLACHGLVDPKRPMRSALAVTRDRTSDGLLTVEELFRIQLPAELTVLSACETGRGKVYGAEGIMGLTRAFMYAGSPRVVVSLWKVDDKATQALMTRFYELWNPRAKPGDPERAERVEGLSAAAALKAAQAHVRSHENWKHPYYWAAWALWGLK